MAEEFIQEVLHVWICSTGSNITDSTVFVCVVDPQERRDRKMSVLQKKKRKMRMFYRSSFFGGLIFLLRL